MILVMNPHIEVFHLMANGTGEAALIGFDDNARAPHFTAAAEFLLANLLMDFSFAAAQRYRPDLDFSRSN